jgi:SAM-dependent methyltransferase
VVGLSGDQAIWHDVECASYEADLPLWRELAADANGAVLDLGCGTGRVALDLAARGHDVTGIDSEPDLVRTLSARARERGLRVCAEVGDVRSFALGGRRFAVAIAPMQVVQLLGGAGGRARMLGCVLRHLRAGGLFAAAIADPLEDFSAEEALPPLPDVREEHGWVYSSTPVAVRVRERSTAIDRLRQAVSPRGELAEALATIELDRLAPEELERAARDAGYEVLARRRVPPTDDYVGSAIVMLAAP